MFTWLLPPACRELPFAVATLFEPRTLLSARPSPLPPCPRHAAEHRARLLLPLVSRWKICGKNTHDVGAERLPLSVSIGLSFRLLPVIGLADASVAPNTVRAQQLLRVIRLNTTTLAWAPETYDKP